MFCGTGKTRVFYTFMLDFGLSVGVFPTLALADQFVSDYIENANIGCKQFEFSHLRICSDDGAHTTTSPEQITKFLKKNGKKIIAVTYASLQTLFDCMKELDIKADTVIYDEAHHVIGKECQRLVFNKDAPVEFQAFFTATYLNSNGIVMFKVNEDDERPTDCGPCVFRYSLQQAIEDGYCQDFEFCVFLSQCDDIEHETEQEKLSRMLGLIANAIVTNDCSRVIINHAFSEAEDDVKTSVRTFATEENEKILISEIKKLKNDKKVVYNGISAKHKNRGEIIKSFNEENGDEIHIISQCRIFAEGIDTRHADMTVFIDEKSACHVIIQTIGRITRKKSSNKKGVVLLPVTVDKTKMEMAKTKEERDSVIRDCVNEERNFNPILNVMTALREEDPEYYDMCLKYPCMFSPKEIEKKIAESNKRLGEKGNLKKAIESLLGEEVKELEDGEEDLEKVANAVQRPIRVVTQNMEDGKTFENYGKEFDDEDVLEVFRNSNGQYQPITKKEGVKKAKEIERPTREPFKNRIKIQSDSDFKILYDIDKIRKSLTGGLIASLKSEMYVCREEKVMEKARAYVEWYNDEKKLPNSESADIKEFSLGKWMIHYKINVNHPEKPGRVYKSVNEYLDKNLPDWNASNEKTSNDTARKFISDPKDEKAKRWFNQYKGKVILKNGHSTMTEYQSTNDILDEFIPNWRIVKFDEDETKSNDRAIQWVEFYKKWGKKPSHHAKDRLENLADEEKQKRINEAMLGDWLQNLEKAMKGKVQTKIYQSTKKILIDGCSELKERFEKITVKDEKRCNAVCKGGTKGNCTLLKTLCKTHDKSTEKFKFEKPFVPNTCGFVASKGPKKEVQCGKSLIEGYNYCRQHKKKYKSFTSQTLDKNSDESSQTSKFIFISKCDKCGEEYETIHDDTLCTSCQSKTSSSNRPPPPVKSLDECLDKVRAMSAEEKEEKLAKKLHQEQQGYRPETKKNDIDKREANSLFSERSKNKVGNALILDSSNFLTTQSLIKVGYERDQIFIAQYDRQEYELQKSKHSRVFHQSLNQHLSDSEDAKFSTAWFDYTCTFGGNDGCRPESDIQLYFSRRFPDDESTFAVTFSKREKTDCLVNTVKSKISSIAKKNGYALTDEVLFEYGNMFFFMWEVVERKR